MIDGGVLSCVQNARISSSENGMSARIVKTNKKLRES